MWRSERALGAPVAHKRLQPMPSYWESLLPANIPAYSFHSITVAIIAAFLLSEAYATARKRG
jgi:hypothetical protein